MYPFDLRATIPDFLALTPPESTDLGDLVLTIPVFEIAPEDRRRWISTTGVYSHDRNELYLAGDGAQISIRVRRIATDENGPTRIRVTLGPDEDQNFMWSYELQRIEGGWRCLARKSIKVKGAA
jgi:hypothetical protein